MSLPQLREAAARADVRAGTVLGERARGAKQERRRSARRSFATREKGDETMRTTLEHSIAARRSRLITGGIVFVVVYGVIARHQRIARVEKKLDVVLDEIADDADS